MPHHNDTNPPYFGEPCEPEDYSDESLDDEQDDDDPARMQVGRDLLALQEQHPDHSATHSLMLTPSGNWMTTVHHHGELVTKLLAVLPMLTEPRNDNERKAMEALNAALRCAGERSKAASTFDTSGCESGRTSSTEPNPNSEPKIDED